jgi:outer membrane murein-binding lipoprotein Lpp
MKKTTLGAVLLCLALALVCGCAKPQDRQITQLSAWTMGRLTSERDRMEAAIAQLKPKKDAALAEDASSKGSVDDADHIAQWAEAESYLGQLNEEINYRLKRERVKHVLGDPDRDRGGNG